MAEKLTATDYAGWTMARHVGDKFLALSGFEASVNSLADRLRVGLVHAAAGHVSVNLNQADRGPVRIPNEHWKTIKALAHDDLWQTGQVTVWVREQLRSEPVRYDYHDVRFEPSSLGELLTTMTPAPAQLPEYPGGKTHADEFYSETPAEEQDEGEGSNTKKPALPEDLLQGWLPLFKKAYPKLPEGKARQSIDGMFQDHHVSRKRLRAVLGQRPPGRPTKD